jgi:hypothetical protein
VYCAYSYILSEAEGRNAESLCQMDVFDSATGWCTLNDDCLLLTTVDLNSLNLPPSLAHHSPQLYPSVLLSSSSAPVRNEMQSADPSTIAPPKPPAKALICDTRIPPPAFFPHPQQQQEIIDRLVAENHRLRELLDEAVGMVEHAHQDIAKREEVLAAAQTEMEALNGLEDTREDERV